MNKHLASEGSCVVLVTQTWTEVAVMPGTWGSATAPCWKWFFKCKFLKFSRDEVRVCEGLSLYGFSWTHENSCICTDTRARSGVAMPLEPSGRALLPPGYRASSWMLRFQRSKPRSIQLF